MTRIFAAFLTVLLLVSVQSIPCTTFFINKNGQLIFGRNYDWITGTGMVCVNQKGLSKTSMKTTDGETISWVSQYGSISFNQYGKEFPTGGMNEKGLVVELMWLDGTRYPKSDERPAIGVLQWIQYQLDNCSSVEELIATDKKLRIASEGNTPLHYLVADAKGNAASIEFLHGKMVVHRGSELPFAVLTNDNYERSIQLSEKLFGPNYVMRYSLGNNSIDRFAKACNMVNQFQQTDMNIPVIDYSFNILDNVAQGSYTKWSIVYDISNKKIYFKSYGFTQVKYLSFASFDLSCSPVSKIFDINQPTGGDITGLFESFTMAFNQKIVERSFEESSSQVKISEKSQKAAWAYPTGIQCMK